MVAVWRVVQLSSRAREFGVHFSCYDPDDPAQTVAVYIKPVQDAHSVGA